MINEQVIETTSISTTGTDSTFIYPYIEPDWDKCDCDERCPKCGKKKHPRIRHIWTLCDC